MRLTGLLAVLLFILIVFFAAPAASFAQVAPSPEASHSKSPDELFKAMRSFDARDGLEVERDGVCYTLRTYVMARDERDSDSTHMVRVTRCLPAWRLQFKTATEPVRPADPGSR
jgi:hypothetical protein